MSTILIVEDEPLSRLLAEDTVRQLGFDPLGAGSAGEALGLAKHEPLIDILFTDVHLGSELSGWDVAAQVRRIHPRVPVLYTSGAAGPEDHQQHGVRESCLLPKPYTPDALAEAIQDVLAIREGRDAVPTLPLVCRK